MLKNISAIALLSISSIAFAVTPAPNTLNTKSTSSQQEKTVLNTGVEITTVTKGNGAKPHENSNVEVHYRGTFKDGKEFDSSYKRGQTITFNLKQVIPCWTEGVQHMNVGGKARLYCPSSTAYGSRGAGGAVPPNTDLYFDIELVNIISDKN